MHLQQLRFLNRMKDTVKRFLCIFEESHRKKNFPREPHLCAKTGDNGFLRRFCPACCLLTLFLSCLFCIGWLDEPSSEQREKDKIFINEPSLVISSNKVADPSKEYYTLVYWDTGYK